MLLAMQVTKSDFSNWIYDGEDVYFLELIKFVHLAYYESDVVTLKAIIEKFPKVTLFITKDDPNVRIIEKEERKPQIDFENLEIPQVTRQFADYQVLELACLQGKKPLNQLQ